MPDCFSHLRRGWNTLLFGRIIHLMRKLALRHFMRKLAICLPVVVCLGAVLAQEAETVLKVDVNVVNVLFSVHDKKGRADRRI